MEWDRQRGTEGTAPAEAARRGNRWTLLAFVAGIILFAGLAIAVISGFLDHRYFGGAPVERHLFLALTANALLVIFCWRRHRTAEIETQGRSAAEERARMLASRDPLTGFLNRRSLSEAGAALLRAATRRDQAVALMFVDLDHFKMVNDMHGHEAGDAVLRAAAKAIAGVMPPAALTARFGGDAFACGFVFDARDPSTVDHVASRVIAALSQPIEVEDRRIHLTSSIGVARSDFDGAGIDTLLRSADIAMYCAKKTGRGGVTWFNRAMEHALIDRNDIENGLRLAIPAGQIVPYFEPQIDLTSGRLCGFEVLARWVHPTQGIIPPDRFIPVAEDSGLIAELSLSIMRQAFAAARDWDPSLSLSVNISPYQLRDAWLAQKIIKATVEGGFAANRLEIEITESALFDNLALAQSIVGSLKNQGVRLALDDFGTGYSSLAHLRALPFDRIKIDKSFVLSMLDNADSAAIVNAIIGLGANLNLPVTAEGVETDPIAERLAALGCAKAQGWNYGKPLSIADTRRMLAARGLLHTGTTEPDLPDLTNRRQVG